MNGAKDKKRDEGYRRNRNLSEFIGNNLHISKKSRKFAPDFKMHKYALMISRTPPGTSKGGAPPEPMTPDLCPPTYDTPRPPI